MSNSLLVQPDLAREVISFKPPLRSFTLHNGAKKPKEVMFVGNLMTIPAINVVGPHADTDPINGLPLPGTYVVEDIYSFDQESGDEKIFFDSARAVSHILGLVRSGDGHPARATSPFAIGGISLLPRHPDREMFALVARGGSELAFEREINSAREYIDSVDEKNSKRKANGMDPVPGGAEYARCVRLITKYEELQNQKLLPDLAPTQDAVADEMIDEEMELQAIMKAKALKLVEKSATAVGGLTAAQKEQLFRDQMNDPEFRSIAQREYRFRKKGRMPVKQELLDAAAAAGQSVADVEGDESDTDSNE